MKINSVAVFCGASKSKQDLMDLAYQVGTFLAKNHLKLIYGGASVGLMGQVAAGTLDNKGTAIGVMPRELIDKWEVAHNGLTEFYATENMHQRKQMMYDKSDAFLILPGGFGTLEEFFEVVTWKQIGYHNKPIYLLNHNGFHQKLLSFFQHMHDEGFISQKHLNDVTIINSLDELKKLMQSNINDCLND